MDNQDTHAAIKNDMFSTVWIRTLQKLLDLDLVRRTQAGCVAEKCAGSSGWVSVIVFFQDSRRNKNLMEERKTTIFYWTFLPSLKASIRELDGTNGRYTISERCAWRWREIINKKIFGFLGSSRVLCKDQHEKLYIRVLLTKTYEVQFRSWSPKWRLMSKGVMILYKWKIGTSQQFLKFSDHQHFHARTKLKENAFKFRLTGNALDIALDEICQKCCFKNCCAWTTWKMNSLSTFCQFTTIKNAIQISKWKNFYPNFFSKA